MSGCLGKTLDGTLTRATPVYRYLIWISYRLRAIYVVSYLCKVMHCVTYENPIFWGYQFSVHRIFTEISWVFRMMNSGSET